MQLYIMKKLNFPSVSFRYKNRENKTYIFDEIRKAYYLLTPEEWVRQHLIHFLIAEKQYPKSLISVEKKLDVNGLNRRYDVVVFGRNMQPEILVECKSPEQKITQKTFDQASQYNWILKAPYLLLTNGLKHYICQMDFEHNTYKYLKEIPDFSGEKRTNI